MARPTKAIPNRNQKRRFFNLHIKMILLISFLLICILFVLGILINQLVSKTIENQIGKRALSVASSVAKMDDIIKAFELDDPTSKIQEIVSPIQQATHAQYIVVGNKDGIRYSHPVKERIGKKMVGGDNERALHYGESYITKQTDSLGPAIRGKVPIINKDGQIIGVVSVGFLNENVEAIINAEKHTIWFYISLVFILGIIGAIGISTYIKRLLFHMEPEEISELLLQKEAILQSTKEGIVAINQHGETTMVNKAAKQMLTANKEVDQLTYNLLFQHMKATDIEMDKEMLLGDTVVLVNRIPIQNEEFTGAVATFRRKTDIEHLTKELHQMKQYANTLRAQAHEFSNKLYTILGLIQLDKVEQAEAFIKQESETQRHWLTFLADRVADPLVHGLLQGKYNQANESGIIFTVQEDSLLAHPLTGRKRTALLTSLGNVIENAIESIKLSQSKMREISIYFSDRGKELYFEVEDSGPGVTPEAAKVLFDQGYSTKSEIGRGMGLALSKKALHDVGGEIMFERSELGGALFVLVIPKREM